MKLKAKFGVDYLTLVGDDGPVEDLKECLKTVLQEIDIRQQEIEDNQAQIDLKKLQLNKKMNKTRQSTVPRKNLIDRSDESINKRWKKNYKPMEENYQKVWESISSFSIDD